MTNFYHFVMAMFYLKIAHYQPANTGKWFYWIEKSMKHANKILERIKS